LKRCTEGEKEMRNRRESHDGEGGEGDEGDEDCEVEWRDRFK
jgi:hypothetical protein